MEFGARNSNISHSFLRVAFIFFLGKLCNCFISLGGGAQTGTGIIVEVLGSSLGLGQVWIT